MDIPNEANPVVSGASNPIYNTGDFSTTTTENGGKVWTINLSDSFLPARVRLDGSTGIGTVTNGPTAHGVSSVSAKFGQANDSLTLKLSQGQVEMGNGDDTVNLINTTGARVDGGAGFDKLFIDRRGSVGGEILQVMGRGGSIGADAFTNFENVDVYLNSSSSIAYVTDEALATARIKIRGGTDVDMLALDFRNSGDVHLNVGADNGVRYGTSAFTGFDLFTIIGGTGNNVIRGSATGSNVIYGQGGDDKLTGGASNDLLMGGAGHDVLTAKGGQDILVGGIGDDTYVLDANSGAAQLVEGADEGKDTVLSSLSYTLTDNIERLILRGTDNLSGSGNPGDNLLAGNAGNNQLWGADGNDTVIGRDGDDTLVGGAGRDVLIGGAGEDMFVFDVLETSAKRDWITDFVVGEDHIGLAREIFASLNATPTGMLDAANFVVGSKAQGSGAQLIYNDRTGSLYFDNDGAGANTMVQLAILTTKPVLTAEAFVVI